LIKHMKPAGSKVLVGAIPGAVILTNNLGEIIALNPDIAEQVSQAIHDMLPFAKNARRYKDDLSIPISSWIGDPNQNTNEGVNEVVNAKTSPSI